MVRSLSASCVLFRALTVNLRNVVLISPNVFKCAIARIPEGHVVDRAKW
jgi:hypothetical protein